MSRYVQCNDKGANIFFSFKILRVQSPEGTKRIEIKASDTTCSLFERVHDSFEMNSFAFGLYRERNQKNEIASSKTKTVSNLGLRHGDMIYLFPLNGAVLFPSTSVTFFKNYFSSQFTCFFL